MLEVQIDPTGCASVILNRAEMHNAFNEHLIVKILTTFKDLSETENVRVIVLSAEGRSFSAGADLNWMQRMAQNNHHDNLADAKVLSQMLHAIYTCPKPTLAAVQGPCYGGGVGLIACCDIAIASEAATFSFPEVKLGIIPATIAPYVIASIGERKAHRYFLTAERFDVREALKMGLVHEVVPSDQLMVAIEKIIVKILKNSPKAITASKDLIHAVANKPINDIVIKDTAQRIADIRATDEGKEGISAFLEKRDPSWVRS